MSKFNAKAYDPATVEMTRDFVRRVSPLGYIYGPSGTGKTTLLGSLFRHDLYRRVLCIDADQGTTTIAEYTYSDTLCDLRGFADTPDKQSSWLKQQLIEARRAECGAIIIEGFMSVHRASVAHFSDNIDLNKPHEAMQAHAKASNSTGILVEQIHAVKQWRVANKIGVPIIVTLNTREVSTEPGKIDAPKVVAPDISRNLCEKTMSTADAFIELKRDPGSVSMLTLATPDNAFRKLRCSVPFAREDAGQNAAAQVQRQTNLDLPGLFALWAEADAHMRAKIQQLVSKTTTS